MLPFAEKQLAFEIAQRFIGTSEVGGQVDNPMILAMLKLDNGWPIERALFEPPYDRGQNA